MTKRLHELIEMAERGDEFLAQTERDNPAFWVNQNYFLTSRQYWSETITAEWTVRMKREPRVWWYVEHPDYGGHYNNREFASKFGKPIKCIEVIESEEG